jgi:hypothetical protein
MIFWSVLARVGAVLGMFELVVGLISAKSAPQEASVAAVAVAMAVLPYVLMRAMHIVVSLREEREHRKAVLLRLLVLERLLGRPTTQEEKE